MLSFAFQNVNRTIVLTSNPQNILAGTLFVIYLLLNTLILLLFAVSLVTVSAASSLFHLKLEKDHL